MTKQINSTSSNLKLPPPAAEPTGILRGLPVDVVFHACQFLSPKEILLFLSSNRTLYPLCKSGIGENFRERTSLPTLAEMHIYRRLLDLKVLPISPKVNPSPEEFSDWVTATITNLHCTFIGKGHEERPTLLFRSYPEANSLAPHPSQEPFHLETMAYAFARPGYNFVQWAPTTSTLALTTAMKPTQAENNDASTTAPTLPPYEPEYYHYPTHVLVRVRSGDKFLALDYLDKALQACFDIRWYTPPSLEYAKELVAAGAKPNFPAFLANCFTQASLTPTARSLEAIEWCLKTGKIDLSTACLNPHPPENFIFYNPWTILSSCGNLRGVRSAWPTTPPGSIPGANDIFFRDLLKLMLEAKSPLRLETIGEAANCFLSKTVSFLLQKENRAKLSSADLTALDSWSIRTDYNDRHGLGEVRSVVRQAYRRLMIVACESFTKPVVDIKRSIRRIDIAATMTVNALVEAGAVPEHAFDKEWLIPSFPGLYKTHRICSGIQRDQPRPSNFDETHDKLKRGEAPFRLPLLTACLERHQKERASKENGSATTAAAAAGK
jgi:hypothetical protein